MHASGKDDVKFSNVGNQNSRKGHLGTALPFHFPNSYIASTLQLFLAVAVNILYVSNGMMRRSGIAALATQRQGGELTERLELTVHHSTMWMSKLYWYNRARLTKWDAKERQ
ncbi:hypothetical protein DLM86_26840 [Paenibacillus flagellatus]|uniref:Uncharacterized protein n=1 Tax=Paenibacillus flagellatus TaxID=2211139 RepID=A0A2V5JWC9_9BACL|nr:hypothetical protein DLM86_26840 [Paenibacillus flagellatus]